MNCDTILLFLKKKIISIEMHLRIPFYVIWIEKIKTVNPLEMINCVNGECIENGQLLMAIQCCLLFLLYTNFACYMLYLIIRFIFFVINHCHKHIVYIVE